jgi:rhamnosyl/mannosyltransferase
MRVLHVGKFYPPFAGGMESFLGDLVPALQRKGVCVAALVHEHRRGGGHPRVGSHPQAADIHRAPTLGSLLYAPVSPVFPLMLRKLILDFQPDLLHLHVPNTSAFWPLVLGKARTIPWVIHWHSDVVASQIDRRMIWAYRLYRPLEQRLLQKAAAIIVSSFPYLATSRPIMAWRTKCRVVSLGIQPARLDRPDAENEKWAQTLWGRGGTRILSIGRLTYYKGHEVLLRAAVPLANCQVIIAGEGDRRPRLQRLIDGLHLRGKALLAGHVSQGKLQALLATCDLLCLPSVERTEAFGVVLLEAMRYGKPVAASDVRGSGIGWVVRDRETGLLCRPGDAGSLSAALQTMIADPALRRRMGAAGFDRFNRFFHIDRVADEITALYRSLQPHAR